MTTKFGTYPRFSDYVIIKMPGWGQFRNCELVEAS